MFREQDGHLAMQIYSGKGGKGGKGRQAHEWVVLALIAGRSGDVCLLDHLSSRLRVCALRWVYA